MLTRGLLFGGGVALVISGIVVMAQPSAGPLSGVLVVTGVILMIVDGVSIWRHRAEGQP
jgi:hypothetical protein